MPEKENKIHTGFRLSKNNLDYIDGLSKTFGITRTNVVDMIFTLIRKDKKTLLNLIKKQLEDRS